MYLRFCPIGQSKAHKLGNSFRILLDWFNQGLRNAQAAPLFSFLIPRKTTLAGFRPNSEIIGKFRKLKKFYGHFVKRQK